MTSRIVCIRHSCALLLALSGPVAPFAAAAATTHAWPDLHGGTDCLSTLQDCIDTAAAGDTVVIGQDIVTQPGLHYYAFSESISIGKSLTLKGADGLDAVFAVGNTITVGSPASGAVNVTLDHLVVRGGYISITHNSDTASTYTVRRSRFSEADTSSDCSVEYYHSGSGSAQLSVNDNVLAYSRPHGSSNPGAICAFGGASSLTVDISANRIGATNDSLNTAILVKTGNGGGTTSVARNQLRGAGYLDGIVYIAASASAASTLYVDDNAIVGNTGGDAIDVTPANTLIWVRNNTLAWNRNGLRILGGGAAASGSGIYNNLFAFNSGIGIYVPPGQAGNIANDYDLVYGNDSATYTPGPHTVVADPLFRSYLDPRPNDSSPALDAGNNTYAPTALGIGFDADGEKRIVNSTVDIGAFEASGDQAIMQSSTVSNTAGNTVKLDGPWLSDLGTTTEHLLVTPLHQPGGDPGELAAHLGVYETGSAVPWSLFREDLGSVSAGRSFAVFAPIDGHTNYLHVVNSGNTGSGVDEFSTQLDNAAFNGLSNAVLFVEHNWNQGGTAAGAYFDHPLGVFFSGSRWHVHAEDNVPMPSDGSLGVNVVAAPLGSPNAFTVYPPTETTEFWLSHPLLDGNPCAVLMTTRNTGTVSSPFVLDTAGYSVRYTPGGNGAPGHWSILAEGSGPPTYTTEHGFNVMVHGSQANACRDDVIFADGFDP